MTEKLATDLEPGDVILYPDHKLPALAVCRGGCYFPMQVRVSILRGAEVGTETVWPLAGRPCVRVWARREDTGAEGYVTYGPAAQVPLAVRAEA